VYCRGGDYLWLKPGSSSAKVSHLERREAGSSWCPVGLIKIQN
jgi:hypothetical protein